MVDPNELIVSVLRRDRAEPPPPAEAPLVVVMAALDREQVATFARTQGVTNVDAFLGTFDNSNLWDFARRPLDLDWLVGFWRAHGELGPLAGMLELSLRERLRETDPQRDRKDPLDAERAMTALERIGAALVLQGLQDIAVPDSGLDLSESRPALDLAEILPDWSGEHRARLISRAVFDPASAGQARLHNDNEGVVRGYLAARWLKRLMDANCPKTEVADLLFARTYGVPLVVPSMRQTTAWLSLWSPDIAQEVVTRDPRLLMDAGDPASLPLAVREQALKAIVAQVVADDEFDIPDRDSLRRFASSDMAPCVRDLWTTHGGSPTVRKLLLLMIWLGELSPCADLAVTASFGTHADHYTQMFSGRALMAVAADAEKRRYAVYIRDRAGSVPSVLVWDAVDALFPTVISVDDLLLILKTVDVTDLDYLGPKLPDRLASAPQVQRLIAGLLDKLEARLKPTRQQEPSKDEPFLGTIEAAGRRLLEMSASTESPPLAIDAALCVGVPRRYGPGWRARNGAAELPSRLQATPERRRAALWHAAERFAGSKSLKGKSITDVWKIEILGYSPGLTAEDFSWLLQDAESRPLPNERQIAANAALRLWRQHGEQPDQLALIQKIGGIHAEVNTVIRDWIRPRVPSEEERTHEREMRRIEHHNAVASAKHDQSWRDFADRLRADPDQLRAIKPPTDEHFDSRLNHLWRLLHAIGENRNHFAINDLTPLKPILGPAVVDAVRRAFVACWRHISPELRSERPAEDRSKIRNLDCIGITGVTLEAAGDVGWAAELSYGDAVRAAIFATLELGGFPSWFGGLAEAQPDAVREVLTRAIGPELVADGAKDRCEMLENIALADVAILSLLADQLFAYLKENEALAPAVLQPTLRILSAGYRDKIPFASLLRRRAVSATTVTQASIYLRSLFEIDPAQATDGLETMLAARRPNEQTQFVLAILPSIGGGYRGHGKEGPGEVPFHLLERLVRIAFRVIRPDDDNEHLPGNVYSPDARDDAESARSALFETLVDTHGLATFEAIHRLIEDPDFAIRRQRLLEIARDRASKDSEHAPWSSADVCGFEADFMTLPRNALDLQRLVLRKLADLQHDLLNADFAQGPTVALLPHEVNVQNWMADRLRKHQGRSYSVEREPHVVEEKEPDIRFRAKASDASVPMEIKVARSWSLPELEDALKVQLIGQYLRDRQDRYGILLLVHQRTRPRGWKTAAGWLTFEQVVDHLRGLARSIAAESPQAPQAEIATIDVSSVATTAKSRKKSEPKGQVPDKKTQSTEPRV